MKPVFGKRVEDAKTREESRPLAHPCFPVRRVPILGKREGLGGRGEPARGLPRARGREGSRLKLREPCCTKGPRIKTPWTLPRGAVNINYAYRKQISATSTSVHLSDSPDMRPSFILRYKNSGALTQGRNLFIGDALQTKGSTECLPPRILAWNLGTA